MANKGYTPWKDPEQNLTDAVKGTRTTKEVEEGQLAVKGIQEKMGKVLKKDQALKVSMHISEPEPVRAEGEVWTDSNSRTWTMKNGKKEAYSHFQDARRPWFCPKCGNTMNGKADDRMWLLRGKCSNCVIKEETQMRIDGTWPRYEKEKILSNQIAYLKDKIAEVSDVQRTISDPENHFADGTFEKWNIGIEDIKRNMQGEIDQLEALLAQTETIYETEFGQGL